MGKTLKPQVKLPRCIRKPDGLIGELAEYFYEAAYVPNRVIAYVTALVFMTTIMGGRYRTDRDDVSPGLYISLIGASGIGKDSVYRSIDELINKMVNEVWDNPKRDDIRLLQHYRISKKSSIEGIEDHLVFLKDRPNIVITIDEMGIFMQGYKQDKVANMVELLTEHFNSKTFPIRNLSKRGKGKSGSSDVEIIPNIQYPCISLVGASTMGSLVDGIGIEHLRNGFLGRILWFNIDEFTEKTRLKQQQVVVGRELMSKVLNVAKIKGFKNDPSLLRVEKPIVVTYEESGWHQYWQLDNDIRLGMKDEEERLFKNRVPLQAKKIAIAMAVGKNRRSPVITEKIAADSLELALFSAELMIKAAQTNIVDSNESEVVNKMKRYLDERVSVKKATTRGSLTGLASYRKSKNKDRLWADFFELYGDDYNAVRVILTPRGRPTEIIYKSGQLEKVKWIKVYTQKAVMSRQTKVTAELINEM